MPSPTSDVSVIIPTRNSAATLGRCLETIIREKPGEIIAVDMSSTDETLHILEQYQARILLNHSRSLGYSRQLGVDAARGRFVMFVDSDVELSDGCIAKLLVDIEKFQWAGVHATVLSTENVSYWQRAADQNWALLHNHPGPSRQIGSGAALFRRETLLRHPFDVTFAESAEDVDLSRRLVNDGCPLGVSSATAYHLYRREFREFAKQEIRRGRSNALLAFKFRSTRQLINPLETAFSLIIYASLTGRMNMIPFWATGYLLKFLGTVEGVSRLRAGTDMIPAPISS